MTQLCQNQAAFKKLNTRVIIISFGTLPAIQNWLKETCDSFDVLLDRERTVYQAYGLERSFWRAYSLRNIFNYFRMRLAGWKELGSHGDDTTQLGGDFIVDSQGNIRLAYRSYDPTDRPSIKYLLDELQKIN